MWLWAECRALSIDFIIDHMIWLWKTLAYGQCRVKQYVYALLVHILRRIIRTRSSAISLNTCRLEEISRLTGTAEWKCFGKRIKYSRPWWKEWKWIGGMKEWGQIKRVTEVGGRWTVGWMDSEIQRDSCRPLCTSKVHVLLKDSKHTWRRLKNRIDRDKILLKLWMEK